ncbi:MAG: 3-oxoacyl-ACP synthase [Bacteroidota bacterium]
MKTQQYITSWCVLKDNTVNINGRLISNETSDQPGDLLKQLYRSHSMSYPKFFKMDALSRLAFVCSELLLDKRKLTHTYQPEDIGVILSNRSASLHTDMAYNESIIDRANYFPNPSLFVYTLPNIMIGEICIRNGIKGENSFFVSSEPDFDFLTVHVNFLFDSGVINCCLSGWVEVSQQNHYEATLFLIEKNNLIEDTANFYTFAPQNVNKIHTLL